MGILCRFLSLPIRDQRLLVLAVLLSLFFKVTLRRISFRTLLLFSSSVYPIFASPQGPISDAERVVWAVSAVAKHVPVVCNCLVSALTAKFFLALEGCSSVLEIGVKVSGSNLLTAHAWLTVHGKVFVGSSERGKYVALPRFDGERI